MARCTACGQAKRQSYASQNHAAARSAAKPAPGSSQAHPLVVGGEGGDAVRVRVAASYPGLRVQQQAWVTGSGVEALIEDGTFVVIGSTPQKRRVWKVGGFVFTSSEDATAAAEKLGLNAVEIA